MVLLLDHVDSFVFNLARCITELGWETRVIRADAITVHDVVALAPSHVVLSPGPCAPALDGVGPRVIHRLGALTPILGVCLGHQCIAQAYGGKILRARQPMHGKVSRIEHTGQGLFQDLPNPLCVTRYHSLVVDPVSLPACLRVTAQSQEGEIMALAHVEHPVVGVQFHPEALLSEGGYRLLSNFLVRPF